MVADAFDPILGIILQGTGNNNNSWGTTFNNSAATPLTRAIAGIATRGNTGGTLDLSGSPPPAGLRQDIDHTQLFNGVLASDLTVIVPNLPKTWWFHNSTSGGFSLFVKTTAGTAVQIPQGVGRMVMCDGANNVTRHDKDDIGSFRLSGKTAVGPGELLCNGASLLRASFPDLFNAIGTTWGSVDGVHFTLPNFTDTGRYLRSSSGTLTVGTYQASQNKAHTHTGSGTTSTESATITHNFSATSSAESATHTHAFTAALTDGNNSDITPGSVHSSANQSLATGNQGANHTHTISGTTGGQNQSHTHTFAFTTSGGSADGTEARPESAVVLICIRY